MKLLNVIPQLRDISTRPNSFSPPLLNSRRAKDFLRLAHTVSKAVLKVSRASQILAVSPFPAKHRRVVPPANFPKDLVRKGTAPAVRKELLVSLARASSRANSQWVNKQAVSPAKERRPSAVLNLVKSFRKPFEQKWNVNTRRTISPIIAVSRASRVRAVTRSAASPPVRQDFLARTLRDHTTPALLVIHRHIQVSKDRNRLARGNSHTLVSPVSRTPDKDNIRIQRLIPANLNRTRASPSLSKMGQPPLGRRISVHVPRDRR